MRTRYSIWRASIRAKGVCFLRSISPNGHSPSIRIQSAHSLSSQKRNAIKVNCKERCGCTNKRWRSTTRNPGSIWGSGMFCNATRAIRKRKLRSSEHLVSTRISFAALYNLGVTYAQMGRRDEAIASYQAAAEKGQDSPQTAFVWNNLGALHRDAGEVDEALVSFTKAAEFSPMHLEARFNAAMIHVERGETTEAISLFEQAKTLQPNHELVNTWLGLAYLREQRAEDAHRCLLLVRRLHPSNWQATIGLAALVRGAGNETEARALYEDALA